MQPHYPVPAMAMSAKLHAGLSRDPAKKVLLAEPPDIRIDQRASRYFGGKKQYAKQLMSMASPNYYVLVRPRRPKI